MANIEVVGKSIEDAVQAAASELKIPEKQAQYEILDPLQGHFGDWREAR